MSVWVIVGVFCLYNDFSMIHCSTILQDSKTYNSKKLCEKNIGAGSKYKCLEGVVMNKGIWAK